MTGSDEKSVYGLLLFGLGDGIYASKVSFIREIVMDSEKMPLPGSPDYIPGVINLRSEVVKVIDIRRIIPLKGNEAKKRVIVFVPKTNDATRFGMVVDSVYGIMDVPEEMVNLLDRADSHIQNNFMLGFFNISLNGFLNQSSRQYIAGDEDVVWIDFEDLIETITAEKADDIIFRLTALFNPDYLLSGEWKKKGK